MTVFCRAFKVSAIQARADQILSGVVSTGTACVIHCTCMTLPEVKKLCVTQSDRLSFLLQLRSPRLGVLLPDLPALEELLLPDGDRRFQLVNRPMHSLRVERTLCNLLL